MENLERITNKIKLELPKKIELNEERFISLINVYYLYQNLEMKPGSFHKEKYKTYDLVYLANEVQKGKGPLNIMNNILDECEEYSRQQIIKKNTLNQIN